MKLLLIAAICFVLYIFLYQVPMFRDVAVVLPWLGKHGAFTWNGVITILIGICFIQENYGSKSRRSRKS